MSVLIGIWLFGLAVAIVASCFEDSCATVREKEIMVSVIMIVIALVEISKRILSL